MENATFENIQELLNGGKKPEEVFDYVSGFLDGFARVGLNDKYNLIDENGNILSPNQWFDKCWAFHEGFAHVKLNGRHNYIDKNGKLLSNQWFDGCENFNEGFAYVLLNAKYNWIDKNGKILSPNLWFDVCWNFQEGFCWVRLNDKYNFIDENGNLLSPNQWFDGCWDFNEGFAWVRLNGKRNYIDSNGNLYDENKNPIIINNEKPNSNNHKDTLIINLYGGPGTGKSTGAAYIFSRLKLAGIDAEYVSEFAKDKVWENNCSVFDCQFYITGKQAFRIKRCFGKVDVIITDSPIRLGEYYAEQCSSPKLSDACREEADRYNNNSIDIFLERKKAYNPNGRNQTEEEAKKIDEEIIKLLVKDKIKFFRFNATEEGYNDIINFVLKEINQQPTS